MLRRNNRGSKYDQLVDEVDLLDCNPGYARVRYLNGKEETVSTRYLAPVADTEEQTSPHETNLTDESVIQPSSDSKNRRDESITPTDFEVSIGEPNKSILEQQ